MNWNEKCRLIESDPVTCARHFYYQVSQFLTNFLLKGAQPLGKISDWFYRGITVNSPTPTRRRVNRVETSASWSSIQYNLLEVKHTEKLTIFSKKKNTGEHW